MHVRYQWIDLNKFYQKICYLLKLMYSMKSYG